MRCALCGGGIAGGDYYYRLEGGWYVRRAWSGSPGGTFPESVAGRDERGRRAVTLYDLSLEYDSAAQALRERICRLEEEQNREKDGERRLLLAHRLRLLRSMWRDTREVARHLEHYYEKGVSRNENISYDNASNFADLAVYTRFMAEDNSAQISRLKRNLSRALRQDITERQRQYMALYYGQSMSMEAIAKQLGVNKSTVSRTLKRGRQRLYRCLRYGAAALLEEADSL